MNEFEKTFSFENLYKAHRRTRLGKRHKKEVIEFENNLSENLWNLFYDLDYDKYEVGKYHKFMIYDPKEREIQAISYKDRVFQHCLCDNYLTPLLERHLINTNVACRRNKGTEFAIKYIRNSLCSIYKKGSNNSYYIKLDISKYFNSINHELLIQKIKKIVKEEKILNLLEKIIYSYEFEPGKGLPMGNQTIQNFALLYLNSIDKFIKEKIRIKYYIRYMDDMLIFVDNKEKARQVFEIIKSKIEEDLLKVNPKSQVYPLTKGISFLAYSFKLTQSGKIIQTLKRGTKRRIIKKCKNANFISQIMPQEEKKGYLNKTYISYKGMFQKNYLYSNNLLLKVQNALHI